MSFILEALKRADRERRLERAPDLSAVYDENSLSRYPNIRPWLWLSGSLLVVAIVVGLMLWPEGPDPVTSPLPQGESASRSPSPPPSLAKGSEGLQAKRSSEEASGTQPVPRPLRKAKPAPPIRSVTEKTAQAKIESKPVEKAPEPKSVPTAGETTTPIPDPVQPSPSVASIPEKTPMKPAASDQSKSVEKQAKTVTASPAKPSPAPAAKEEVDRKRIEAIPLIGELPYEIKEKLGKLQINVHSYSQDPAERLVFINMRRYEVGDKIEEDGPLLKEIIPNGVIIDYGEGEVRLQVGR